MQTYMKYGVILCILLFFFFEKSIAENDNSTSDNEQHCCDLYLSFNDVIKVKCKNSTLGYESFIACKIWHGSKPLSDNVLELSSPFVVPKQPKFIRDVPFFVAKKIKSGIGAFYCKTVNRFIKDIPKWDFNSHQERNLDYKIYLQLLSLHPELRFQQKDMKMDLFYFSPYIENTKNIYVLTWNPETQISTEPIVTENVISFPVSGEEESKIGIVVSPLLSIKKTAEQMEMNGNIAELKLQFLLHFRSRDKHGHPWVLSWRKLTK